MEILSIPLVSHTFNISQKFSLCYYPFDNQEHICIQNFVSSVIFSSVLHSLSPQISKLPSSTTPTLTLIQMETVFSSTVIYNVISINVQPKDKTLQTQRENRLNFFFFFFPLSALSQCVRDLSSPNPLQYSCLENPMDRGAGKLQPMGSQNLDTA